MRESSRCLDSPLERTTRMSPARRLLPWLSLLLAASRAAAAAPPPPTMLPLPGGAVAEPTGRTGFLPGAAGLEAIDLATGDVLWHSAEAQRPLLLDGGRLYAQAGGKRNRLRVLAFDLSRK